MDMISKATMKVIEDLKTLGKKRRDVHSNAMSYLFFLRNAWFMKNSYYFEVWTELKLYLSVTPPLYADKKENKIFLIYTKIQSWAVSKSFMRKGFLIYE